MILTEYCVYLPLQTETLDLIQGLRQRFDPLAELIPPHVTLVFPFKTNLEIEAILASVTEAIESFRKFHFTLGSVICSESYVFLPVVEGEDEIRNLHAALYGTDLKPFRSQVHEYSPHVTIGRYKDESEAKMILSEVKVLPLGSKGTFNRVILESIDSKGHGILEGDWTLK